MVDLYTTEEWEENLKNTNIEHLDDRYDRQRISGIDWKSTIVMVDHEVNRQKFRDYFEWTKEHCKGKTTLLWPQQLEFELEEDAMWFRLVWG